MGLHAQDHGEKEGCLSSLRGLILPKLREEGKQPLLLFVFGGDMNIFRSQQVPKLLGLEEYISSIGDRFCPFLVPSMARSMTTYSVYELDICDIGQVQELMFYIGLLHTEILRRVRFDVSAQHRPLACENVFFRFEGEDAVDGAALFGWPHWLLKIRYTQVGVMFGKFWKGEEAVSRDSVPIPPPPYHMLSLRSTVKRCDPAFFARAPELLESLIAAEDSGQRVFDDVGMDEESYDLIQNSGETVEAILATSRKLQSSLNLYQRLYQSESCKRKSL